MKLLKTVLNTQENLTSERVTDKYSENFYPRLYENPDGIHTEEGKTIGYNDVDKGPMPFGIVDDKLYIGNIGTTHGEMCNKFGIKVPSNMDSRQIIKYSGRIWRNARLISFWDYPPKKEFQEIIKKLSEALSEDMWKTGWRIEIVLKDGNQVNPENTDWDEDLQYVEGWKTKLIDISDYTGGNIRSKEVSSGSGSKSKRYQQNRQWQMATLGAESIEEPHYPRLFEKNQRHYDESVHEYLADKKSLPPNVKHRLSSEYGRRPIPLEEKEIDKTKKLYKSFKDGKHTINAYFVDIKYVRDISYGDFVEGGNDFAYPNFIPTWEIWIDHAFKNDPGRADQILVHEAIERKLMEELPTREYYKETATQRITGDVKHEGAHEEANLIERKLRDGEITLKDALDNYYK